MKRITGVIMTGALLVVTLTQPFLARAGEIEERQRRQQGRIAEGIEGGALTPKEAAKLEGKEAHIQREKKRMRKDGKLSAKEKAKLNRDLNKTSKEIYKEQHD